MMINSNSSFVPLGLQTGRYKYANANQRRHLFFAFLPKATNVVTLAGLLACPAFDDLPVPFPRNIEGRNSGSRKIKSLWNSQHRGMLRILTGFPFNPPPGGTKCTG